MSEDLRRWPFSIHRLRQRTELPVKLALPLYVALMLWVPEVSVLVVNFAAPPQLSSHFTVCTTDPEYRMVVPVALPRKRSR